MADSIGAVGGSQIDVNSLASQLVEAERAPLDAQIQRATSKVTTQVSALGTLMGALSTFRSALSSLKTESVFGTRSATSSNEEVFTASAGTDAVAGSYDIEVVQLARAQQLASDPFPGGGTTVVGTGTLTLSLGSESFTVEIGSGSSTLADIRDAINSATGNPGITATLINGTDGSRLVLTSAQTGADYDIEVAQSGGDGGLAQLTYSAAAAGNYTQNTPAQDAVVRIATFESTSATNVLEDAIDGVTLNLAAASEGTTVALTVGYDTSAVTTRINTFVNAYNTLKTQITKLGGYDAANETAGSMLGDSLLTGIDSQLRRTLSGVVEGTGSSYQTLASIGITTQADGTLAVNSTKLQTALNGDFDGVSALFGSENGIAATLFSQVDGQLETGGAMDVRSSNLIEQQKDLKEQQERVDARMEIVLQRYIKQFTTLDTLLSTLETTSAYLTQELEQLSELSKSSLN